MELERNKCTFSAVKFESTSYNQEGSKFHLVITVYLLENKFEFPKILIAKISPPVFVDSRKSAKENYNDKVFLILKGIKSILSFWTFSPRKPWQDLHQKRK